jgi:hypothetical protein
MSTGLIKIIKQAAMEAVESGQPTDIRTGVVTNVKPLTIQITPQFILPSEVLIVPKHLTDYKVKVSFNWNTEVADTHKHIVQSEQEKDLIVHNALKIGDKVALLRQKGGQFYYILDRIE